MKIRVTELRQAIRTMLLEYNDQDYQNVVNEIVELFYVRAEEYGQYMPLQLDSLSPEQIQLIFDFEPPEFVNLDQMDSSAMLELNPLLQTEINEWLANQDWYDGDEVL